MPNGADRNWIRLCLAIDGFRARYGRFPLRVAIEQFYIDNLAEMFSEEEFRVVREKMDLVPRCASSLFDTAVK
jgi:hypothetical protein